MRWNRPFSKDVANDDDTAAMTIMSTIPILYGLNFLKTLYWSSMNKPIHTSTISQGKQDHEHHRPYALIAIKQSRSENEDWWLAMGDRSQISESLRMIPPTKTRKQRDWFLESCPRIIDPRHQYWLKAPPGT